MVYEKSPRVYSCCGKIYATINTTKDKEVVCQICKQIIKTPIKVPKVIVIR